MSSTTLIDRQFEKLTFTFSAGISFHKCTFTKCRMVLLSTGRPQFFDCIFVDCLFDPTMHHEAKTWEGLLHGSSIAP
jgi:hypothetical protein